MVLFTTVVDMCVSADRTCPLSIDLQNVFILDSDEDKCDVRPQPLPIILTP